MTVALTSVALAARSAAANEVFHPEGVLLKPTDSHYYVRFAQLQQAVFPRFATFDPWVNFPEGAQILWPPLHTWWVALHTQFLPGNPEAAAAWVGLSSTLLWLPAMAALTRRIAGAKVALIAVVVLALLPGNIESSAAGNADHHVHEPYLALALALLVVQLARTPKNVRIAVALGVVLAASRLLTTGTVVLLPCVAVALFACLALDANTCRSLARTTAIFGGTAALLTGLFALVFGELTSLEFVTLSGFLPTASVAAFGLLAALLALRGSKGTGRVDPWVFSAVPALIALAVIANHLIRARGQLLGEDPLLKVVVESQPLWSTPAIHAAVLGPVAFAGLIGLAALIAEARQTRSPQALVFAAVTLVLAAAFVLQLRFVQPLAGPLAVTIALGHFALAKRVRKERRWAVWLLLGMFVVPQLRTLFPRPASPVPSDEALVRPTMRWIRDHTPAPSNYAVVATHDVGHLLTLWARRPNVSSPLSQAPWHIRGNARAAAVLAATDDEAAYQHALATKARYVLVVPFAVILGRDGSKDDATTARKLLEHAAMQGAGTGHFRLVHDSHEQRLRVERGPYARVFEVVPGATLTGTVAPATPITATLPLITNTGARLLYRREAIADEEGRFTLRLAYPTQSSAEVRAEGPYRVELGAGRVEDVQISEADVREGANIALR